MNLPIVDIIISTYGTGESIGGAIESIRHSTHTNFRLWVLDQNEDDRTKACVTAHAAVDPRIQYLRVPLTNIAVTRNYGASLSCAAYLLFTNDDCTVDPDWISRLVRELSMREHWAVFGRVLPGPRPPRTDQVLGLKTSLQRTVYRGNCLNLGFGHGHNMGVHRERFVELGGFDEMLGGSPDLGAWEERDFGYRILRRGGGIVYTPDAIVYHHHWQCWDKVQRSYQRYGLGVGAAVAKYVRCGDPITIWVLMEWQLQEGLRQIVAGLLKSHSIARTRVGLTQLIYPWLGLWRGLKYPCDARRILYQSPVVEIRPLD
jgi:GT2 family glycosyltransferase